MCERMWKINVLRFRAPNAVLTVSFLFFDFSLNFLFWCDRERTHVTLLQHRARSGVCVCVYSFSRAMYKSIVGMLIIQLKMPAASIWHFRFKFHSFGAFGICDMCAHAYASSFPIQIFYTNTTKFRFHRFIVSYSMSTADSFSWCTTSMLKLQKCILFCVCVKWSDWIESAICATSSIRDETQMLRAYRIAHRKNKKKIW